MLDLIFVSLFAAAAGDPAPAATAAETSTATTSAPAANSASTDTSTTTTTTTQTAANQQPQRVCHLVPVVGSIMRQRVCTTAEEDRRRTEQSQRALEDAQERNGGMMH